MSNSLVPDQGPKSKIFSKMTSKVAATRIELKHNSNDFVNVT